MIDLKPKVKRLHREAMSFVDEATVARLYGEREKYLRLTRQAYAREKSAADLMINDDDQLSRSVLHRSAATLAWRCGKYDEAEKLIYRALAGNPPPAIEWELEDLLAEVQAAPAEDPSLPKVPQATHAP